MKPQTNYNAMGRQENVKPVCVDEQEPQSISDIDTTESESIKVESENVQTPEIVKDCKKKVSDCGQLNLRDAVNGEAFLTLPEGTEVEVLKIIDAWSEIKLQDGTTGYVVNTFLK